MTKLFISATSADLASARTCAKRGLETVNYTVVEQNTFETDYGTMLERLERKIAACDGIVHIVGYVYGAEPNPETLPQGSPRRSYTQWEYHLARKIQNKRKNFKIYAFLTADEYPASVLSEPEELRQLQIKHRTLLNPIKSTKRIACNGELEEKVKEIQLAFERERRMRRSLQTTLAIVIGAIVVISLGGGFSQHACQAPGLHSVCKQYGWGGVPTFAQEVELSESAAQGCEGLKVYALRDDVPLSLRDKAERALRSKKATVVKLVTPFQHQGVRIFVGEMDGPPSNTRESAQKIAEGLLQRESEISCGLYLQSNSYERTTNTPLSSLLDPIFVCNYRQGRGHGCSGQAVAVCHLNEISYPTKELCNG
jgi:hypothetical protein